MSKKKTDPPKLDYWEIDKLARAVAFDVMDNEGTLHALMLLCHEIATHPFDTSHVETVANLTAEHLYAVTRHADESYKRLMVDERAKLGKGGE